MKSARQLILDHQPVSVTNFITHAIRALFAPFTDVVYHNPNFKPQDKDDNGIAIVCMHGIADRVTAFALILERIKNGLPNNISSIYLISSDRRMQGIGIQDYSLQLKNKLLHYGIKDVILMGHSRGALIVSDFTERLAKTAKIKVHGVLAIGGPFAGSWLAIPPLTWFSDSIAQMQIDSDFLKYLSAAIKKSKVPYHFFAAANDFLVNYESSFISDHPILKYERHGHVSLLSSHKMVEDILNFLRKVCIQKMCVDVVSILKGAPQEGVPTYNEVTMLTEMIDDFVKFSETCQEIESEIIRLKSHTHLWSPKKKIEVLEDLKFKLTEMDRTHKNTCYPTANTLTEFINCFLDDKTVTPDTTPRKVLSQPLTGFFLPASFSFINKLRDKSKDVLLPKEPEVQPTNTPRL